MKSKRDWSTTINSRLLDLILEQSNSDDVYDKTVSLRSAISLAMQQLGFSRFGLQINDIYVPAGRRIDTSSIAIIGKLIQALESDVDDIPTCVSKAFLGN